MLSNKMGRERGARRVVVVYLVQMLYDTDSVTVRPVICQFIVYDFSRNPIASLCVDVRDGIEKLVEDKTGWRDCVGLTCATFQYVGCHSPSSTHCLTDWVYCPSLTSRPATFPQLLLLQQLAFPQPLVLV